MTEDERRVFIATLARDVRHAIADMWDSGSEWGGSLDAKVDALLKEKLAAAHAAGRAEMREQAATALEDRWRDGSTLAERVALGDALAVLRALK